MTQEGNQDSLDLSGEAGLSYTKGLPWLIAVKSFWAKACGNSHSDSPNEVSTTLGESLTSVGICLHTYSLGISPLSSLSITGMAGGTVQLCIKHMEGIWVEEAVP